MSVNVSLCECVLSAVGDKCRCEHAHAVRHASYPSHYHSTDIQFYCLYRTGTFTHFHQQTEKPIDQFKETKSTIICTVISKHHINAAAWKAGISFIPKVHDVAEVTWCL